MSQIDVPNASHIALKDIYKGIDIYVLGSGASMAFIDHSFFEDKICIGTNSIYKFFPVKYSVIKHKEFIKDAVAAGQIVIYSKHDCGDITKELIVGEIAHYVFTHKRGRFENLEANLQENLDALGKDDDIFVSYSTITSSIHLAAYMGAKNIILAGHDCGYIDELSHVSNYADHIKEFHNTEENLNKYYDDWFDIINRDTIRLKERIEKVYDCNIYSINPFINFRLEGHKYDTKKQ